MKDNDSLTGNVVYIEDFRSKNFDVIYWINVDEEVSKAEKKMYLIEEHPLYKDWTLKKTRFDLLVKQFRVCMNWFDDDIGEKYNIFLEALSTSDNLPDWWFEDFYDTNIDNLDPNVSNSI